MIPKKSPEPRPCFVELTDGCFIIGVLHRLQTHWTVLSESWTVMNLRSFNAQSRTDGFALQPDWYRGDTYIPTVTIRSVSIFDHQREWLEFFRNCSPNLPKWGL